MSDQPRDWRKHWENTSAAYIEGLDGPYHRNRLDMVRALLGDTRFDGKSCLDFGCGDGAFAHELLQKRARVVGIDTDQLMVDAAKRELLPGWPGTEILLGGVDRLPGLADGAFDFVIALNVLAYLSPEEERRFYEESRRILRSGGLLIVTHSNYLFDLFTLNKYTLAFFDRNFSLEGVRVDVAPLLRHPDKPDRHVFGVRENLLAYRFKLEKFGFRELRQEFAILHRLPPLLTPQINFDDINSREYPDTTGWPEDQRWKLMFMCSMFGSCSVRT